MLSTYSNQFLTIASLHFVAVICPGPDFALISKRSLLSGRETALWASFGIGLGMLIHALYAIIGLKFFAHVLHEHIPYIRLLGGGYLLYLGLSGVYRFLRDWRKERHHHNSFDSLEKKASRYQISSIRSLSQGLITNALNPKGVIFVVSIFSVVVDVGTPNPYLIGYAVWMFLVNWFWFSIISFLLGSKWVRKNLQLHIHYVEVVVAMFFIGISVSLLIG